MRPSLFRAPSLILGVALAIAPSLAWAAPPQSPYQERSAIAVPIRANPGLQPSIPAAPIRSNPYQRPSIQEAPIRANLGQRQSTTTEVRWQPITPTETVTEPWQIVGSKTRVDRSQPNPQVVRFQEVRTDDYRQRATTYPLEAKEERKKKTTTQDYELRTYAVRTATSAVLVPVTTEVGEWVTSPVEKPVTAPVQVVSTEPRLVTVEVPVYKTVTATYSIPGQPIYSTVPYTRYVKEAKEETVTKTKTESYTATQRNAYNGRMVDSTTGQDRGTVRAWGDETGLTLNCPDLRLTDVSMRFTDSSKKQLSYKVQGWGRVGSEPMIEGKCQVTTENGRQYLEFEGDLRHMAWTHWWGGKVKAKLNNALFYDTEVPATREVEYTETVTKWVDTPYPRTLSIQGEKLTNTLEERFRTDAKSGVYWKHYHHDQGNCPFEKVEEFVHYMVMSYGIRPIILRSEFDASQTAAVAGKLATRVLALDPEDRKGFTLVAHHTDILPTFADDATPTTLGTRQENVIDRYDTQQVWSSEPHMVTKQVPVKSVIRWDPLPGARRSFAHSHDDPAYRCSKQYVVSTRNGNVTHSKIPVFGPLLEKVVTTDLATRSVTVSEPRIVTSTSSVIVGTVPGQDISTSFSPWSSTGEQRRVGTGTTREATRSVDVPGPKWAQDILPVAHLDIAPLKAQSTSYKSDLTIGNTRQSISGSALRKQLKTSEAISSRPKVVLPGGSITRRDDEQKHDNGQGGGNRRPTLMSLQSADDQRGSNGSGHSSTAHKKLEPQNNSREDRAKSSPR